MRQVHAAARLLRAGIARFALRNLATEMNTSPPQAIQRIEAPSRDEFKKHFVEANRPVILTGVASRWHAASAWSAEYLNGVAGDAPVNVYFNEEADFHQWYQHSGKLIDIQMPLRELLKTVHDNPSERRYYMTMQALDTLSPDLVADVDFTTYQLDLDAPLRPCLFVGRDVSMPLHYHGNTDSISLLEPAGSHS